MSFVCFYDYKMCNFLNSNKIINKYAQLNLMTEVLQGKVNTWDIQWVFSIMINEGISITPNLNLVKNLGFNGKATHTTHGIPNYVRYSQNGSLDVNIIHPQKIKINRSADVFTYKFVHKLKKPNIHDIVKLKLFRYISYLLSKN